MVANTILNQIGNTPLVRLKQASELTGCHIYGKAEYFNPGESVKDRAALFIVKDALNRKLISKGGTIVEGTAGNTGIGLAIVCKEYNLKLKIVIPKTQSIEKKETLRNLGAELIEVEAVPYSDVFAAVRRRAPALAAPDHRVRAALRRRVDERAGRRLVGARSPQGVHKCGLYLV